MDLTTQRVGQASNSAIVDSVATTFREGSASTFKGSAASSLVFFAAAHQGLDIPSKQQENSLTLSGSFCSSKNVQGKQHDFVDSARQSPSSIAPIFREASVLCNDLELMSSNSLMHAAGDHHQDTWCNIEGMEGSSLGRLLPELDNDSEQLGGSKDQSLVEPKPSGNLGHRKVWGSVEDDIFSTVGGLELGQEAEPEVAASQTNSQPMQLPGIAGLEDHQLAEQPSRTLFVRANGGEISDEEISNTFQAYGDIRQLYTACKHRGFFTVSYYDLRSANQAAKALQGSALQGCQLDIHFSVPKAQADDGGINQLLMQGTVLVFNLDPDTTNEQLVWIFSNFGEVKEIREKSFRSNQKFIEFYDIRHAAAALRAMNKAELAGKQPSGPAPSLHQLAALGPGPQVHQASGHMQMPSGGEGMHINPESGRRAISRPATLNQLMSDQVQPGPISQSWDPSVSAVDNMYEQLRTSMYEQAQRQHSQAGSSNNAHLFSQGGMLQGGGQLSLQAINQYLQQLPQQQANELAATLMQEGGNSLAAMKLAGRGGSHGSLLTLAGGQGPLHGHPPRGMHVSDSASSIASTVAANLAAGGPGNGGVSGGMYIPNMNSAANFGTSPGMHSRPEMPHPEAMFHHHHQGGQQQQNSGFNPGMGHMQGADANMAAAMANLTLGGSPEAAQYMWNSQMAAAAAANQQVQSGGGPGWNPNMFQQQPNAALQAAAANLGLAGALNMADMQARQQHQIALQLAALQVQGLNPAGQNPLATIAANLQSLQGLGAAQLLQHAAAGGALGGFVPRAASLSGAANLLQHAGLGMQSLHSLGIAQGGPGLGIKSASTNSLQSVAERQREAARGGGRLSRRNADPAAEAERKMQQDKLFALDSDKIRAGEDRRTTLMIKNIPNKYTQKMLLATVDESLRGSYDFFYLPIDFKNKCNVGYAFINMTEPINIIPLIERFNGKKWERFNSEKVCHISYARIQGKAALVAHFQNSSLMHEDKRCRPVLFHSEGPEAGEPEPFPVGNNVRARITHGFKDREVYPATSRDPTAFKG